MKTSTLNWSLFRETATSWSRELEEARPLDRYSAPLSMILRKLAEGRGDAFDGVLRHWVRMWLDVVLVSCADAHQFNASMLYAYHERTPTALDVHMSILWILSAGDQMSQSLYGALHDGHRTPTNSVLGRLWNNAMRRDRGLVIQAFHAHMVRYVKDLVKVGEACGRTDFDVAG